MRQRFSILSRTPYRVRILALAGLIILTGCAQPASVGIPTPNAAVVAARQTSIAQSVARAAAAQTAAAPSPTPAPTIEPPTPLPPLSTDTPAPLPPLPAETPLPPAALPDAGSQSTQSGSSRVVCGQQIIHIVQPGQNLFRIALRYNTTINAIARLNGITNTRLIRTGQRLRVVTCARSNSAPYYGAHYVVRPGDTLFRIAMRYGVSVSRLMAANDLRSTLIVPGQNLIIP